jgi:uncharacterized protein YkwD
MTAALALLAVMPSAAARGVAYNTFYSNYSAEELMRLLNSERASHGLPALAVDASLESVARDAPVTCPSNHNLVIRGRARDMADRQYLSHTIKACNDAGGGSLDEFELLRLAGYSYVIPAAETLADNNYPTSSSTYKKGCTVSGGSCTGTITGVPWTVAVAATSLMTSSAHRAIVLSTSYARFGCGAWTSSTGYRYYACYFAHSGSGHLDATGPALSGMTGAGATYAAGSTPTFSLTATDALSVLSDGWAAIDGHHIRDWAWDHAGRSAAMSAKATSLTAGAHTLSWWIRDGAGRATSVSVQFTVSR